MAGRVSATTARAAVAALLLFLGGCASPERQLRTGLTDAGIPDRVAACMASDMNDRLSVSQLLKLRSLSRVGRLDPARTSIERYLHQVRALRDTEILTVTTRAAARCTLGL